MKGTRKAVGAVSKNRINSFAMRCWKAQVTLCLRVQEAEIRSHNGFAVLSSTRLRGLNLTPES